jgi:hypothetical protein
MRAREILSELGLVVPGINSTCDVGPGETKRQASKFGNTVDDNGLPPTWTGFGHTTGAKDTPNKDKTGKQTFYGDDGKPANKKAPVVEGLIEGPFKDGRVLPRTQDGEPPKHLYRVMSDAEYTNGSSSGVFRGRPIVHASAEPDLNYAEPGANNVLVKIAYTDQDGWRAKHTLGMGVVAITDAIPADRVEVMARGTRDDLERAANAVNEETVRLPLNKGGVKHARSMYGAMICVMNPADFIRLTTTNEREYQDVLDDAKVSLDDFKKGTDPDFNKSSYNIPFLRVVQETGKVKGHEGRHRAARVLKAGGDKFPCVIYFRTPMKYTVTYYRAKWNGEEYADDVTHKETFNTADEANARAAELETENDNHDSEYYNGDIRRDNVGNYEMKGSPRSQGWDRDPWQASDMPANFIGEFNASVVIPTSRMRFAPIKKR